MTSKSRVILISVVVVGCIAIVLALAIPNSGGDIISGKAVLANNQAKQVNLALLLYANEHGGRLPTALGQLVPQYIDDKLAEIFFDHLHLTAPGANLKELPDACIIELKFIPSNPEIFVVGLKDGEVDFRNSKTSNRVPVTD